MKNKPGVLFVLILILMTVSSAGAQDFCTRDTIFPTAGNCGYDIQDYQLEMAWDLEGDHWDVSEVLTLISEWDTDELTFDFTDTYEITAITVNGSPVKYDRDTTKLTVHYQFSHDTEYKLYAAFSGKLQWGALFDPEGTGRDPQDGFCMLNEPTNAWRYYICNDHPKDKATYHYSFTVPASYVPAGSGRLLMIEEANDTIILPGKSYARDWDPEASEGTVTFTYALEYPTVPYLFTVCAGAFDLKLNTLDDGKVQLDFVDRGHPDKELAWRLAGQQSEIISALEPFFGDYPYGDLGGIFAKIDLGAALETLGRSLYDNSSTDVSTVAHETAHQWMGDLISLADWSDLWIKEGAAVYGQAVWEEYSGGREAYETYMLNNYDVIVNGLTTRSKVNDDLIELLKMENNNPTETLYDHDIAAGTIANYCQIDRDRVQLKEGNVTIDEWAEGLKASCDTITLGYRTSQTFYEMIGAPMEASGSDHFNGPKDFDGEDINKMYSREVYYGGSIVYHSLREKLGDAVFSQALQTLIEENKWGTVNEEKFIEVFSRVFGEDLTDFIKSYLYYGELGHVPDLLGIETWEEARSKFER